MNDHRTLSIPAFVGEVEDDDKLTFVGAMSALVMCGFTKKQELDYPGYDELVAYVPDNLHGVLYNIMTQGTAGLERAVFAKDGQTVEVICAKNVQTASAIVLSVFNSGGEKIIVSTWTQKSNFMARFVP